MSDLLQVHQYVQSLGRVAREIGVEVRCGAKVEQLRLEVWEPGWNWCFSSGCFTHAKMMMKKAIGGWLLFQNHKWAFFSAGWSSGRGGASHWRTGFSLHSLESRSFCNWKLKRTPTLQIHPQGPAIGYNLRFKLEIQVEADVYVLAAGANSSKVAAQAGHHSHTRYLSLTVCKKRSASCKIFQISNGNFGCFWSFCGPKCWI